MIQFRVPSRLALSAAFVMLLLALTYLSHKAVMNVNNFGDVRYFWIAGKLWAQGVTPYSEAYGALGKALYPDRFEPLWVYPPHWYLICRLLAMLPHAAAGVLWMVATIVSIAAAGLILWETLRDGNPLSLPVALVIVSLAVVSMPAIMTILYGQSTGFVLLGAACLLFGAVRGSRSMLATGIFLVMLKPNFGLVLCFGAALIPGALGGVVIGGIVIALASLPAFMSATPLEILGRMMHDMGLYAAYYINRPANLVGVFHLIYGGAARPSIVLMLLASLIPVGVALGGMRAQRLPPRELAIGLPLVAIAASLTFALPHEYDLLLSLPLAFWAIRLRWLPGLMLAVLPLAAVRVASLEILSVASMVSLGAALFISFSKSDLAKDGQSASVAREK